MYGVVKSNRQTIYIFSIIAPENVAETYRRKTLLGGGMLWFDSWIWKCVKLNDSYCNRYVCNVCGLHHMTVHAIITTLSWNDVTTSCRALEHPHNTNADSRGHSADQPITPETIICFEVGPAVVCGIAIFKKAQEGHRCNVSLRYAWFWEMSYIFHHACLFWVGCVKWLG